MKKLVKKGRYFRGISLNIIFLGIVSFLADSSSEMIFPILPMFITALGGTGVVIGLIGGLKNSIGSILRVFAGYLSDKIGRRKIFVSSGYLISAVFKLFLSFSKVWEHVLIFVSFERAGKGIRTAPRDAIIADSIPKEKGKGFGIHRSLDTFGAVSGSLIVFILFWHLEFDFKSIIFIAAIIGFFSLIPLLFVKEDRKLPQNITFKLSLRLLPKGFRLYTLIGGIFALANFSYMFFILKAQSSLAIYLPEKLALGIPIFLYILFNVFYAVFAIPFGILSDKIGRKKILISGYLLFGIVSLGFTVSNVAIGFVALFALYGIVYAMVEATQRAYAADLSTEELRGTALGTFHTTVGLTALAGSVIAGLLWEFFTPSLTFIYGATVSIIAVILFIGFKKYLK